MGKSSTYKYKKMVIISMLYVSIPCDMVRRRIFLVLAIMFTMNYLKQVGEQMNKKKHKKRQTGKVH